MSFRHLLHVHLRHSVILFQVLVPRRIEVLKLHVVRYLDQREIQARKQGRAIKIPDKARPAKRSGARQRWSGDIFAAMLGLAFRLEGFQTIPIRTRLFLLRKCTARDNLPASVLAPAVHASSRNMNRVGQRI